VRVQIRTQLHIVVAAVCNRGPTLGNLGEGLSTGDFEMDEGGSVDELPPSLFEEALWRGPGEEFLHWER